jgi:hypothetical protein
VRDSLGIRLGETDDDIGREVVALHCWRKISIRSSGCSSRETPEGAASRPKARLSLSLGCGPAHRALVENRATVGADLLLDLVRDPGVLAERVRDHGLVLVQPAGSLAAVAGCHFTSHVTGWSGVNKIRKGEEPASTWLP